MAIADEYLGYSLVNGFKPMRDRSRYIGMTKYTNPAGGYASGTVGSYQRTIDEGDTGWPDANRIDAEQGLKGNAKFTSRFDLGGRFFSRTVTLSPPYGPKTISGGAYISNWYYTSDEFYQLAQKLNNWRTAKTTVLTGSSDQNCLDQGGMFALGGHAIAQTLPNVPQVSIAQTLGELREGLPSLIGQQFKNRKSASSAGSEYLNFQFGIAPIVQDILNYVKVADSYDEFVRQYNRDRGRMTRRMIPLGETHEVKSSILKGTRPSPDVGNLFFPSGQTETITTVMSRAWASVAYKSELPLLDVGGFDRIKDFSRTYGVDPTPSTVWQLIPFTWLLDWVVNIDDLMTNMSYLGNGFKGVSLQRAYVMQHTTVRTEQIWTGTWRPRYPNAAEALVPPIRQSLVTETKQRRKASPFGFGLTYQQLSLGQKAILTALGLSKMSF